MNIIEVKDLKKSYGKTRALRGIDLIVKEGEIHGFIGMNGAGKSTAIKILLGILKKDSGLVNIFGKDAFENSLEIHKKLSYVPGDIDLWPNLSGGEIIDFLSGLNGNFDKARKKQLIERFQFDPNKKYREYSKGNRQKVILISALLLDAELYILDEPTSGLDPLMENVFQECIRELASKGKTVFLSSHILSEVEKICDSLTIIKDGIIVESGNLSELRHFSQMIVNAECNSKLTKLESVDNLKIDGNKISFSVDDNNLNNVLKKLTDFGIHNLSCNPPELEDIFLHFYNKDGDQNE